MKIYIIIGGYFYHGENMFKHILENVFSVRDNLDDAIKFVKEYKFNNEIEHYDYLDVIEWNLDSDKGTEVYSRARTKRK